MRLAVATRNALANAYDDYINNTGAGTATIKVYSGTQPTNPDTALSGNTLLATFNLTNPAFGNAATGTITLSSTPIASTGAAAGTATFFRLFARDGTSAVADGSVGTSGADLNLNTTTISVGVAVEITSGSITVPLGT